MGLPYIDLMLIHSPQPWAEWRNDKRYFEENIQVWKALEDAYTAGKVKAIGVSNVVRKSDEYIFPKICRKNVVKSRKSSAKASEKSM